MREQTILESIRESTENSLNHSKRDMQMQSPKFNKAEDHENEFEVNPLMKSSRHTIM